MVSLISNVGALAARRSPCGRARGECRPPAHPSVDPRALHRGGRHRTGPQGAGRTVPTDRGAHERHHGRAVDLPAHPVRAGRSRVPVRRPAGLDRRPRHLDALRDRRDLVVPRRAHRRDLPDRDPRCQAARQPEALLRLVDAAHGGIDRRVHRTRPRGLLRVLRDRAGADVLPHRSLGARTAHLRRHEVLPLHDARLGTDAGRDRVAGRPPSEGGGWEPHVRPGRDRPEPGADDRRGPVDLRCVRGRVRGQGPVVPPAHLVARCAHRGARPPVRSSSRRSC